jgi:hypothetical protein
MKLISTGFLVMAFCVSAYANYLQIQNVTATGNNAGAKTIQLRFDLSWENSWRDDINWDAVWLFVKYKDNGGLWQHAKINITGANSGTGTANTIKVSNDNIGAFVYRSAVSNGAFSVTNMELQWNYGLSGLSDVTGLEVRVFGVEMVYIPEGDFNVGKSFYTAGTSVGDGSFNAPGSNFPVINNRLTPSITYNDGTAATIRIKGDAGIDSDNNGTVDKPDYPTGYKAFYCYKYELTQQQYADFLNTLTAVQITTLGNSGADITLTNGQYFSSQPNYACGNATANNLLAYADWSGIRPMSILEFNKASYGPLKPVLAGTLFSTQVLDYPAWGSTGYPTGWGSGIVTVSNNVGKLATASSTRQISGASYYGVMDLTAIAREPVVKMNYFTFTNQNGDGVLNSNGTNNVASWNTTGMVVFIDQDISSGSIWGVNNCGFRYVRSAE